MSDQEATGLLIDTLAADRYVYICGNGGSASDADHFEGEMLGRFKADRRPFKCICLSNGHAATTGIANDYGYENVFARKLEAYAGPGDLLICLSTSGESENVRRAHFEAKKRGTRTLAIVGPKTAWWWERTANVTAVFRGDTGAIQDRSREMLHRLCAAVDEWEVGHR